MRLKENIGGSGGFYKGIKMAAELKYRYIWIMDDDTIAKDDACIELYETAQLLEDDFGYLSSTVIFIPNGVMTTFELPPSNGELSSFAFIS